MSELTITKERVLKAAETCGAAKETLKTLFPDAFKSEPFDFGKKFEISTATYNGPVYIGFGHAPKHLDCKCLMVGSGYRVEQQENDWGTVLVFYKKD